MLQALLPLLTNQSAIFQRYVTMPKFAYDINST